MSDTFKKIKEELSVYYPDVTDDELETMTKNLITFFKLSAKAVYAAKKAGTRDTSSKNINYIAHISAGINYTSRAVSVVKAGMYTGVTCYSYANPVEYASTAEYQAINANTYAITTYNNNYHDAQVSTVFRDTLANPNDVGVTTTDYESSDLYKANNLPYKYVTSYIQRYIYDIDWKYSSDKKLKLSLTELQMPYNNMFVTAALAKNIQESENIFDLSNIIPDGEKYKIMYSPYVSYETGEIYAVLEFESGSKLYLILTLTDDNKCFAEAKACLSPSISFASWKENEYKGKEFSSKRLLLTNGQSIYQQEQIINFYR